MKSLKKFKAILGKKAKKNPGQIKREKELRKFLRALDRFEKRSRKINIRVGGHTTGLQVFVGVPIKVDLGGKKQIVLVDLKDSRIDARRKAHEFLNAIENWKNSLEDRKKRKTK